VISTPPFPSSNVDDPNSQGRKSTLWPDQLVILSNGIAQTPPSANPKINLQLPLDLVILPNFTFPLEHLALRLLPLCPLPFLPPQWWYWWLYRWKHHTLRRRRQRRHSRCSRCQISGAVGNIIGDPKSLSIGNLQRRKNRLKRAQSLLQNLNLVSVVDERVQGFSLEVVDSVRDYRVRSQ